jgi:hypothetical protein
MMVDDLNPHDAAPDIDPRKIVGQKRSIGALLADPESADVEFEPPRLGTELPVPNPSA